MVLQNIFQNLFCGGFFLYLKSTVTNVSTGCVKCIDSVKVLVDELLEK